MPLKMKYRFRPGKKWDYFVNTGFKFIYVKEVNITGETTWQGCYPEYYVVLYDLPEYGFTTYRNDTKPELQGYNQFMTSIIGEFCISKSLGRKTYLEFGFFFEQGISDLNYNQPAYEADYLNTIGPPDKTTLRSFGMIFGFRYNFIHKK